MLQYMMVCLLVVIGVAGLIIEEHKMTEEEPFSACYTFQYKLYMYFGDHERPPTCTPAMYEYHVIFTLSKDPDENVKQMVKNMLRRITLEDYTEWTTLVHVFMIVLLFKFFDFFKYLRFDILENGLFSVMNIF